jgi:hypothetical protein
LIFLPPLPSELLPLRSFLLRRINHLLCIPCCWATAGTGLELTLTGSSPQVERSELALLRSLICLDELAVPSHSKLLQPWQTEFFSSSYHPIRCQ